MTYQPWMIKYRPSKFDEIVGQDHVVSVLQGMLQKNYICPSIIFTGPWGSGKTSVVRLVAKSLLCEHPFEGESCNSCASCLSFDQSNNINYIERDAASHGKVADIRELVKLCEYPPMGSSKRVVVLDEAHRVTSEGWNALLKTLETSVDFTVFMFCTTEGDKILDTIKSRSREFPLTPIPASVMVARMKYILLKEECATFESSALDLIAEVSKGHLRDAINLLEQAFIKGGVTTSIVQELTGHIDSSQIKEALDLMSSEPMSIFGKLAEWLQLMTPQDITLAVHDLIIKHQIALWQNDSSQMIKGWGDCLPVMNLISTFPTPTTLTQLQNFLVQLISKLKLTPKEEVSVRSVSEPSRPKPAPQMRQDTGNHKIVAPVRPIPIQSPVAAPIQSPVAAPIQSPVAAPIQSPVAPAAFTVPLPVPQAPSPAAFATFATQPPQPIIPVPQPQPASTLPTPSSTPIDMSNFLAQFAVKKPIAAVGEGPLV